MLSMLRESPRVVGVKQVMRALQTGSVLRVFVAKDADPYVTRRAVDLAQRQGIPVLDVPTMRELGEAAGVEVPSAVACVLKG